ncbi:acyl-CoA dehydrogenase [Pseudomonas plecoglossicida]|uniref:Acyl-CoA dehydrogenase n=1 Tax=Pseudomonas plecoglossicida TaxID=70775 RepID=A0AAD0QV50_PSEDL|nr:acyl-CoA dehydrogenase family protein [Pseudomonas plecoglossicida]AXM94804.1 acyl-CoA dehydrogenase [Pseudomonas plecoglossicida]EPB97322.1 acyl-CoA dehydrogenase [Pseudomonas plecoglossicida NB2011]QLB55546.1 acyl-CoA/acyl-ACP dehydrogenase [Pseudomonas plecoglossicida]GLR38661.1 acyl-CoA dehydrogenase [Pseudomonas plecoglossicida]
MSIIQDFDLNTLDSLLRTFSERPQALNLDTKLAELMQALLAEHLDLLPLPGQGHTLQRWQTLARIAGCDLALAKLYEGHTDALAILAECSAAHRVGDAIWGVWAAEPPDARARIVARDGEQVRLAGRKAWCSGALQIDRALITAWTEHDRPQLVAIELAHARQRLQVDHWQAVGMATTTSVEVEFDDAPGIAVGQPGQYLSRPGFWHGGAGIAACWYGAAEALADYLREHCRKPRPDPHAQAHLGAVDAALYGARAALRECAAWIDRYPSADASFEVRRVRAQVEQSVEQVIHHVGRALGATPFCRSSHFARLSADLPVYLRQSHAERDLAALGQQVAQVPAGAWQL